MDNVIFSSWQGNIVDNRGKALGSYAPVNNIDLPQKYDGGRTKAFMGWDGFVIWDETVNIIDMACAYLSEAQKVCCGECSTGYIGIRLMAETLAKILDGKGKQEDIDLLWWLGNGIRENAKCVFGRAAPVPVLDTLEYFPDAYLKIIKQPEKTVRTNYLSRITAPCMEACPAHQDVPDYIESIKNYRNADSLALIRKTNVLPGICGRACVAFCEKKCTRANYDAPLSIRALKRYPADFEVTSGNVPKPAKIKKGKQKVAVIGAGPAGLAAGYNLGLMGYKVTIYDKLPSSGGTAVSGIPPYRLPREVIEREVELIQKLGVKLELNTKMGEDLTLDKLFSKGFEVVFVGTGANKGTEMSIVPKESQYEGLVDGISFLHDVNMGKGIIAKENVLIVGGGNVAIDCTRTCVRLGFKNVTIVYRRSRTEMPARQEEVADAEKEGVKFTFLANPVKVLAENGTVTGAQCIRMELGEPDASGRRRPIPVTGSEFIIKTNMLITATGEQPDLSFLTDKKSVRVTKQGTIEADQYSGQTSQATIFAGGDCVTGPATIIEAIAAGNKAAKSIDQYLQTGRFSHTDEQLIDKISEKLDLTQQRDGVFISPNQRRIPEQLPVASRIQSFAEVEKVFNTESAVSEAQRCLRCYRVLVLATGDNKL